MRIFRILSLALLFTCITKISVAQLVNIESRRMQTDSIRFAGNVDLNFNYQKVNEVSFNVFKSSLATQLKSKNLKHIFLILGNYDLASSNKSTINNAGFGHLRYNYKYSKWLRWEVYTQLQFNELLSLKYRYLAGTGARIKLNRGEVIKTYFGVSAFYEYEQIQDIQQTVNEDIRMSNYFVLSLKLPKNKGEFASTTYFQPLFRQFEDYRLTNQSILQLHLNKHLSFTTSMHYFFDFNPPAGVKQETFSISNGLRLTF